MENQVTVLYHRPTAHPSSSNMPVLRKPSPRQPIVATIIKVPPDLPFGPGVDMVLPLRVPLTRPVPQRIPAAAHLVLLDTGIVMAGAVKQCVVGVAHDVLPQAVEAVLVVLDWPVAQLRPVIDVAMRVVHAHVVVAQHLEAVHRVVGVDDVHLELWTEGVRERRGKAECRSLGWGKEHVAVAGLDGVPGGVRDGVNG